MRQKVTVLTFQEDGIVKDGTSENLTGKTRSYDKATSLDASGKLTPQAKADTVKGAPLMIDEALAGTGGMTISVTRLTDRKVEAYFRAAANNPLITSPDIDWEFTIIIDSTDPMNPTYSLQGTHDGFPGYDIYIDSQFIFGHNPTLTGEGPFSLFPPMEHSVNESGGLQP